MGGGDYYNNNEEEEEEESNIEGLLKDLLNMYEKNRAMCMGVMADCGLHFIQGKLQFTPFITPSFIENALRADADDCGPVVEVESHQDESKKEAIEGEHRYSVQDKLWSVLRFSHEDDREALLAQFEQRKEEIDENLMLKRRQEREERLQREEERKAERRRLLDDEARGETKAPPPKRRLKRRFRNDTVPIEFHSKFVHKYMTPKNAI